MRRAVAFVAALAGLCRSGHALRLQGAQAEAELSRSSIIHADHIEMIRRHAGLYTKKGAHKEFADTVLVTASNVAYSDMLKNWRCHADKLGLDYIIISLDPDLYKETGPEQTMLVEGSYFREHAKFRQGHFNEMSCTKLRLVKEIMSATGLNVVFSDPDNIFREDPFAKGVSLGDKMRLNKFEYIYQQNHGRRNLPNSSDIGAEVNEGNTGFYFVAGTRKAKGVQALFEAGLAECEKHHNIDDQTNFWQALKTIRNASGREVYGSDSFACADLCGKGKTCSAPDEEVLSYCEMDPWNHATGWEIYNWHGKKIVTYHANYIGGGMDKKIGKLAHGGFWDEKCAGPAPWP